MSDRNRLKELLLQLSYEKRRVTLASGRESNFYFDGKQTALHPEGAFLIGKLFLQLIREKFPTCQAVGGPTLGADPLATAVSLTSFIEKTPMPAFIIRKEPKGHGTQNWIEGVKNLTAQMPVVILEDVVTSGGSSVKAIEKAKLGGLKVLGVVSIVDREEGGAEALGALGLPLHSLFKKYELHKE